MKKVFLVALSLIGMGTAVHAAEMSFPAHAQVGSCYTKLAYPATYKTVQVKELVQKASSRYVNIPAKYKTVYKSVKVRDAAEKVVSTPAIYKEVPVNVKVADAERRVETIPAVYENVEENVMVRAARNVWKEGEGPHQKVNAEGQIVCLVKEPAVYRTVIKKRLVRPATTKTTVIPAKYEKRMTRVLVREASTKVVTTPAIYKTVPIKQLVRPASRRRLVTPAKYRTVEKTVVDQPGKHKWEEVLCETNATTEQMLAVQNALVAKGISVEATGKFDDQTQAALEKYQQQNGLHVGYLTAETMRSLGVDELL